MTATLYADTYNEYITLKSEQKKLGLHEGVRIVYEVLKRKRKTYQDTKYALKSVRGFVAWFKNKK